jgi:prephenate dehydrogenase
MKQALERGAIDSISTDIESAVRSSDLVLLAAPVAQFPAMFAAVRAGLKPATLVTDAGSTKRDVVAAARAGLLDRISQFVPAHPIAGAERSGAAAASAELFRGKRVVLTPLAENAAGSVQRIDAAWSACGARITRMAPEEHDAVLGAVSHLPHLLAYALVHDVANRENAAQLFSYAGGGFRDFTRIASSHPEMWRDICIANRDQLLAETDAYSAKLKQVRTLLDQGDAAALEKLFAQARDARGRWLNGEYDS